MNLLLCRPRYFGIRYEINPWMDVHRPANPQKAWRQWLNLCRALKALGARLSFIAPRPGLPDMVFVANAGSIFGKRFIPSQFRWPQRRGEEPFYRAYMKRRGFRLMRLSTDSFFEGEGDLLPLGKTYFAGYGIRSQAAAHQEAARRMSLRLVPLRLIHPHFYHLDTCLLPLNHRSALFYPPAFDTASRAKIKRYIPDAIPVSGEDAFQLACNGICVGRTLLLHRASRALKAALYLRGFQVRESPVGEFLKSGGSVKCLLLRLSG